MRCTLFCLASIGFALTSLAADAPPMLRVDGNQLKTPDGRTVRLHGVNIASLEWNSRGEHVLQSVPEAIEHWNCNIIRLPLSQDRWFGKTKDQKDGGAAYRKIVHDVVEIASSKRAYVLLDLHWSNAGVWSTNIGQHYMPDANSVIFWESVAPEFANHPAVLFDLYNEPHDVSWSVWRDGGEIIEKKKTNSLSYRSPGMQKLLDTCRAKGARNVIVAGGLDWAYDLSGIVQGHALKDPQGNGVMYATHIYPWKKNWDKHVTIATTNFCVFVGEVGCEPKGKDEDPVTWAPKILSYIEQHQLNWTAWDLHPSAGPTLIKDWTYTPTTWWGAPAKKALLESKP
jgi:hypothetical protein